MSLWLFNLYIYCVVREVNAKERAITAEREWWKG